MLVTRLHGRHLHILQASARTDYETMRRQNRTQAVRFAVSHGICLPASAPLRSPAGARPQGPGTSSIVPQREEACAYTAEKVLSPARAVNPRRTAFYILLCRKNKPEGSSIARGCWCRESPATCPWHQLAPVLRAARDGEYLFQGITAAKALATLRLLLASVGVAQAGEYRTHDLRRGHALDLQLSGAPLYDILAAGDWKSPAFLQYLDRYQLEQDVVMQAHLDESDHAGEDD